MVLVLERSWHMLSSWYGVTSSSLSIINVHNYYRDMGISRCDESHGTDRGINGIKVPIEKPSEESPPTILKPDDFQSRKYLGKGIHLIGGRVVRFSSTGEEKARQERSPLCYEDHR